MTSRRSFIGSILACAAAPAIVRAEILMPVRKIIVPRVFPMEIGHYEVSRFIESPMLYEDTPLHQGMHGYVGSPEYRAAQRAKNLQMRSLMDNSPLGQRGYIAADLRPTRVVLHEDWMK